MLYWLLQSLEAHPALAFGEAPECLLAPEEEEELRRFTMQARRRDWLLGRWTAKRLLQQVAQQHCGFPVPLHDIVVRSAENGAPCTDFREPLTGRQFSLSISHSQGYALCAVVEGQKAFLGADLEEVVSQPEGFVERFFNHEERELIDDRIDRLRDVQVTAIWGAKEAAYKAVRSSVRFEPLAISCLVQPVAAEPQDWIPFPIVCHAEILPDRALPTLTGWWQALGVFVLTVATAS
ncbi:MAG TPA: 4'-phosphopantetheinyl transferase superfamily protein [Candidatus Binatia bacterium]|jgi:4'-phosphopantetheinyl transferase|nr:4'-phosphopantetheinyl transferase superfamily protein [Candidatus Binatia bacterium]